MTDSSLLRDRILFYLDKKDISINKLARISGVSQTSLNNIMIKGAIPRFDTLRKIVDGLNLSMLDFFDFSPYNSTKNMKTQKVTFPKSLNNALEYSAKKNLRTIDKEIEYALIQYIGHSTNQGK